MPCYFRAVSLLLVSSLFLSLSFCHLPRYVSNGRSQEAIFAIICEMNRTKWKGATKTTQKTRNRISDWNYLTVCIGMTPFIEPTNKTFIGKFFWVWSNKFRFIYLINPHFPSLVSRGYEIKCGKNTNSHKDTKSHIYRTQIWIFIVSRWCYC